MTFSVADFNFKKIINYVDWKLLLFLLLFLNVKLAVKIPAIIIIYLLQFNFRFKFSFKNSRLPLFYLLVIAIAFADLVITGSYHRPGYLIAFLIGIGFWLLCILAIHQIKLSVENNDVETIHHTVLVFFVINITLSVYNLAHIMWETGTLNPYGYQGEYEKYFIGTGDYIKGVTFDSSITNAVLNAFGVVYFLVRKKPLMTLACMAVLLLTASNCVNLMLMLVLALLFIFKSSRDQKSVVAVCVAFLVIFMAKISPQNNQYVVETFKNTFHEKPPTFLNTLVVDKQRNGVPTPEAIKRKFAKHYLDSVAVINIKINPPKRIPREVLILPKTDAGHIFIEKPNILLPFYQASKTVTADQKNLLHFIDVHKASLPISGKDSTGNHLPGKVIAFMQTLRYLQLHPLKIIAGVGMGNFSSKLAFRATGLGFSGNYPSNHTYINNDFLANHLDIYLNFFSRRAESHSLTNSPSSVYDQLLVEYGLLGLLALLGWYLWFFAKHYKKLTYGMPLLILLGGVFFIDYWFEQLSVLVLFELLLFLDIKQTANNNKLSVNYEHQ